MPLYDNRLLSWKIMRSKRLIIGMIPIWWCSRILWRIVHTCVMCYVCKCTTYTPDPWSMPHFWQYSNEPLCSISKLEQWMRFCYIVSGTHDWSKNINRNLTCSFPPSSYSSFLCPGIIKCMGCWYHDHHKTIVQQQCERDTLDMQIHQSWPVQWSHCISDMSRSTYSHLQRQFYQN